MPSGNAELQADTAQRLADAGSEEATADSEFYDPMPAGYVRGRHRYVMVFGTVMSGLGKGIFASSLAKLLKDKGLTVAPIKLEGYLNLDSGTLSPYRHGEVFVLDDGLETDMDLGTYERLLDQDLTRQNYATAGRIFQEVLNKERAGDYLGRDVQMIPHVTGSVKHMLRSLAVETGADVVFIEVGGTVGDYENAFYIEALRQLAFEEGPSSASMVALTYVIEPPALGEQKTKAAQLGLKKLLEAGVQPHIVATRSAEPLTDPAREKIAMFSGVPVANVFSMHDRESIYTIPEDLHEIGLDTEVLTRLRLLDRVSVEKEEAARARWQRFVGKLKGERRFSLKLGLTGKYAALRDAYASVDKAIEHVGARLSCDIDVDWLDTTTFEPDEAAGRLAEMDAVIVPGGFGQRGTESKIGCVRHCRESGTPYLGICLGFQMAVIEHARHVAGLPGAGSSELSPGCEDKVVDILPEQKAIEGLGGNMRLGGQSVLVQPDTLAAFLYRVREQDGGGVKGGGPHEPFTVRERFRHRYEVDPAYIQRLEAAGLVFSGRHPVQPIMQVLELPPAQHPFFLAGQFHPELTSRPLRPQPMFMGLIAAAIRRKHPDAASDPGVARWSRASPARTPA
ncbi:CTP synthase [Phycisphaera mikurensis]|nr:CTP synthase [Phycisphaera mikurensis]MBB6442535.1 CTP synthase [Phycisphaera mikurensis]